MTKYIQGQIKSINKKAGTIEVLASTGDVDRDGEVIDPKGWDIANFIKNPVILWAHQYAELPIGIAEKVEKVKEGLKIVVRFASAEANPRAGQVRKLVEEGIQKAVSVGFIPRKRDPNDESKIIEAELLELSFVPVPANPNALALAMKKGHTEEMFKVVVEQHTPPKADMDMAWDAEAAELRLRKWAGGPDKEKIDFKKYSTGFGQFDEENTKKFTSYKLIHHDIVDEKFMVIFNGVTSAMAELLAAREDILIPENERKAVYDHLAAHYAQFDKEPPELKAQKKKAEHIPECDPGNPKFDPEKCAELMKKKKPKKPKKDVAEAIALAGVVDHLDFLANAFEANGVSEKTVTKMREALAILLDVLKTQAKLGKKEFVLKQEATEVQTLILDKKTFETLKEATKWVRDHDFKAEKVDETENSWRFRQFAPGLCQENSFRTIDITDGVNAVICRPEKSGGKSGNDTPVEVGKRSSKDADIIVELRKEVIRELHQHTLKSYQTQELLLATLKRVKQLMSEKS